MNGIEIIAIFVWGIVLAWLVMMMVTGYSLARQQVLRTTDDPHLLAHTAPLVSILVPARNEAERVLPASIASILAQDYGNFEVIAVDDNSTDATRTILEAATTDKRLRVIAGTEVPARWLGKTWALQQALECARGEWILATDADVIFEPTALRTAMTQAFVQNHQALTLIPHFESGSFWERVFIPTWAWRLLLMMVLGGINNPRSTQAKGMGGFFLITRQALKSVGDFRAFKGEVTEDLYLAVRLKQAGVRIVTEYAPHLLRTRMYNGFADLWESCSRNWFALLNSSLSTMALFLVGTLVFTIAPALLAGFSVIMLWSGASQNWWQLFIPALLAWAIQVLLLAGINRRHSIAPFYALFTPLGFALQCMLLLNSTIRIKTSKGVTWKGRRIYEYGQASQQTAGERLFISE